LPAGKAELSRIARQPPCGMVLAQGPEALGDIGFVKPGDRILFAVAQTKERRLPAPLRIRPIS
jgi:hypothetical protein